MATSPIGGKIIFINHDKGYATIEYVADGRKKTINGNINIKEQEKLLAEKIIKKMHRYHVGDEVSFILSPSGNGGRKIADCIEFRYNNALDNLINKSVSENRLVGYLKKVGEDYFVKETGSYIFFPLILSPWEKKPFDTGLNEPVFFKLTSSGKADKITACLYKSEYIPEYLTARRYAINKSLVDASVYKITQHGVFVNVIGNKIQAKITNKKKDNNNPKDTGLKVGDTIKIMISYLSHSRIIVERV